MPTPHFSDFPGCQLTMPEVAYVLHHVGFRRRGLRLFTCVVWLESTGHTGIYRPEWQNPGGGQDDGMLMINSKSAPAPLRDLRLEDKYDPLVVAGTAFEYTNGGDEAEMGAWNIGVNAYGPRLDPPRPARTTANMRTWEGDLLWPLAKAAADRRVNPYRKMTAAGMDTHDLPVPPIADFTCTSPTVPLRPGDTGLEVGQLQDWLEDMGFWSRPDHDAYYGPTVSAGVESWQSYAIGLGLMSDTHPIDGIWDEATYRPACGFQVAAFRMSGGG